MDHEFDAGEFAELATALHAAPTPVRTAEQVVAYALEQLDADHGGITLIRRGGRLEAIAATDPMVEHVTALQNELGEGPCRDSSWQNQTLVSQHLAADPRWPRWAAKAAAQGIASVLAAELTDVDGGRIGAVNVYYGRQRTFTSDDVAFAQVFARHAAVALTESMEHAGLSVALDGRKLIGQAQGILMERHGLDEARAFEVLRRYSQHRNVKLRRVAEYLVSTRRLPGADGGREAADR